MTLNPTVTAQAVQPPGRDSQAGACASCALRERSLFGALAPATLLRLHAEIARPHLKTEGRLYARGDPGTAAYTVRTGIVRLQRLTPAGERRIVRLAGPGDLIGLEALLGQPYADEAVACTAAQLCRLPRQAVADLLQLDAGLAPELMRRWQGALDQAAVWSTDLACGTARQRVLKLLETLLCLADGCDEIWLPRREDMGAMLGLTVETASRVISRLRREGVLRPLPQRRAQLDALALAAALSAP